jgi:hypothetical protein
VQDKSIVTAGFEAKAFLSKFTTISYSRPDEVVGAQALLYIIKVPFPLPYRTLSAGLKWTAGGP